MCLFPRKLVPARHGMSEFTCGVCPECLSKRARQWALRAAMEAAVSPSCMITLTYDDYIRDSHGNIIGEYPPNRDLHVSKRDVQLFIKRLRRHFEPKKIKYIATAEYGKTTHRAHYHVLLFGIVFDDLIKKGKSKRGHTVYASPTLSALWANVPQGTDYRRLPICTVDAINVTPAVARYCTKYCSKDSGRSGGDDTFMLFSRGIGESELMRLFNGKSYIVDGREYPVPRLIWQRVISEKYDCSFRYVAPSRDFRELVIPRGNERCRNFFDGRFIKTRYWQLHYKSQRDFALLCRDSDPDYQSYIAYWQSKNEQFEATRPSAFDRIRALPDDRYHSYKVACLRYLFDPSPTKCVPRSSERSRNWAKFKWFVSMHLKLPDYLYQSHLAHNACHYAPNDTEHRIL